MARIRKERPETEQESKSIMKDIERDIYSEAGVFESIENDQISHVEQGFMFGYISAA
jgi:hypothetical protein